MPFGGEWGCIIHAVHRDILYVSVSFPRDGSDCDEKAGYEETTGAEHKLLSIQLLSLLSCYTESKKVQVMAKKVVVDYSLITVFPPK